MAFKGDVLLKGSVMTILAAFVVTFFIPLLRSRLDRMKDGIDVAADNTTVDDVKSMVIYIPLFIILGGLATSAFAATRT